MSICDEITPTTPYIQLLSIEGLTEDIIRQWRPDAKNIEQILKQNQSHLDWIKRGEKQ